MIELSLKDRRVKAIKIPENLEPLLFECKVCGCLIAYVIETNSYIFKSKGTSYITNKLCNYCYRLKEYQEG